MDNSSNSPIDFKIGSDNGVSAEIGTGDDTIAVSHTDENSYSVDTDTLEVNKDDTTGDTAADTAGYSNGDQADGSSEDQGTDQTDTEESSSEDVVLNDIETFNAEDPANVEQWNKEYLREGGALNIDRLSQEFWRNIGKDGEGLNEATYDFLASKGISKEDVKKLEATAINERDAAVGSVSKHDMELFTVAGGPDELKAALEWGKQGGYTEDQRKKFDKITSGKDLESKKEAVELLMARYQKSDAYKARQAEVADAGRPTEQKRDATKGRGTPSGNSAKPFASRKEGSQARKAAGDDMQKLREVDRRARASGF